MAKYFRSIDVWERISDRQAIRYRCFESLAENKYCVQSADYFYLPLDHVDIARQEAQRLDLFLEEFPDQRAELFDSIELAIANHKREFEDSSC